MIAFSFLNTCLKKAGIVLCLFVLVVGACKQAAKKDVVAPEAMDAAPFIKPPIKGTDVPYKEYTVDAAKGDTLIYHTGSIILFPPKAFVDEAGKSVTGNVQVKYREFTDPMDFFLAGIPMNYDSAGTAYQLESSGMLDIRAFKDGKPVFVNQAAKPEILLASTGNSEGHSLYYLDTVQKTWVNKGGFEILVEPKQDKNYKNSKGVAASTKIVQYDQPETVQSENVLPEPVKPLKADNKSPVLKIVIDPSSFREFSIYENVQFQIDERKTPFNVSDTTEEWNNLELLKGSGKGNYMARFSNARKTATYAVKPVFQGEDYARALKIFEKEYAVYKQQSAKRTIRDNEARAKYAIDSLQNERVIAENKKIELESKRIKQQNNRIGQENQKIAQENIKIEQENKRIEKVNALIAKRNLEIKRQREEYEKSYEAALDGRKHETQKQQEEFEKWQKEQLKKNRRRYSEETTLDKALNSFPLNNFGYWNCDIVSSIPVIFLRAIFKDEKGNVLDFSEISTIVKSRNGILRGPRENMMVLPGADNMILGAHYNKLYYVSFEEFRKLNITADTKEQTFIMKVVEEPNNNYEYIKSLYNP